MDASDEALALLGEIWTLSPDVRLGQLLAHLGFLGEVHLDRGLGYIDDDELLSILYRHREELLARQEAAPSENREGLQAVRVFMGAAELERQKPAKT